MTAMTKKGEQRSEEAVACPRQFQRPLGWRAIGTFGTLRRVDDVISRSTGDAKDRKSRCDSISAFKEVRLDILWT